jgi:predicted HTH transcriptional regulator
MATEPQSPSLLLRTDHVAHKSEATTPARLAETLVALANASGGTLLVGIDPRSGEPQGLADSDGTLDRALKAALSTDPPLIMSTATKASSSSATAGATGH